MKALIKLSVLMLLLPFLWVDNSAAFAQSAQINIGSTAGYTGTRVTIPVELDVTGPFSMKTLLQGKFHFDPGKLKFRAISIAPGTLTYSNGWAVIAWPTGTAGEVEIQGVGSNPISSDGILFYLHFDIVDTNPGFALVTGNLNDWSAFSISGSFSAINPGSIVYTHPVGISDVRGDANLDYVVDIKDVVAIIYHLYYGVTLTGQAYINADADLDSNVDIWDVVQINLYITLGHYHHNIQYIPNNVASLEFDTEKTDNVVTVPIEIKNAENVISAEVEFRYDPTKISFEDFSSDIQSEGKFIFAKEVAPGIARFTYASFSYAEEDFTAGRVNFRLKDGSAGDVTVTSTFRINDGDEQQGPVVSFSPTAAEDTDLLPQSFEVAQNYPNPFNPTTTINFSLPEASFVSVKIYNSLGEEVKTLVNKEMNPGFHSINWNGDNNENQKISNGTYIYRVTSGDNVKSMKMILMK